MAKRFLIFARNYAPEQTGIGPLTTELCKHLAGAGHRVAVLAAVPHYPEWRVYPRYRARNLPDERAPNLLVRRVRIWLRQKPASAPARVAYDGSFALGAFRRALASGPADVVVCIAPPVLAGLTAALVARLRRAPLVLIVQDLELRLAEQLQIMQSTRLLRLARRMERTVFVRAAAVSVISDPFAQYLRDIGIDQEKIHVIPNWVDLSFIRPLPRGTFLADRCGFPADAPVVLYAGNLGEKQGLDVLVRAAVRVGERSIQCVLVGDGSARLGLQRLATELGAANVHFLPLQPRADLPAMLASADLLALVQRPEVVASVVPSKLLVYLASGRPIVASVHGAGEVAHHLAAARCGTVVPPGDSAALAEAIAASFERPQQLAIWGTNARRYVEQHFAKAAVLERFDRLFGAVLAPPARR